MSDILHRLREELQRGNHTVPARPSIPLFAAHPVECDELLQILFAEYDDGAENASEIRLLMGLQQAAHRFPSPKRSAALKRQGVLRAAYYYPPTCLGTMFLRLRDVVHLGEMSVQCERLVRDYPSVAQSLLTQLLRTQKRDHFFDARPGLWHSFPAEIATLRSMISRVEGLRLLDEMGAR